MIGPALHPPAANRSFILFGRMAPPLITRGECKEEKENSTIVVRMRVRHSDELRWYCGIAQDVKGG